MRPASKKEIESFKQWKKNPTPKSKFIFLYGSFMWGIPTGVLAYFISISLNKEPFDIAQFGIRILVFMLAGLLFGYFMYKAKVKRFEELKDQL